MNGSAPWDQTIIHKFKRPNGGDAPAAGVVLSSKTGELFGTTIGGAGQSTGTIFKLAPPSDQASEWQFSIFAVLPASEGISAPAAELYLAPNGKIYGTAEGNGLDLCGAVFELSPRKGGQKYELKYILKFSKGRYGCASRAALVVDDTGSLYGTTVDGGDPNCICGLVFKLEPPRPGQSDWKDTIIYQLKGKLDGGNPRSGVILGKNGNLYGTTWNYGRFQGTIYELAPPPNGEQRWRFRVIHQSDPDLGYGFVAPLSQDKGGALYGATGLDASGQSIFKLAPPAAGSDQWIYSRVAPIANGEIRDSPPVIKKGDIYGVSGFGGAKCNCGFVYRVQPD